VREVTDRELKVAENVSNLANNTVTFFFYLFAGLGAVFAIWGWRSIRDIKQSALSGAESEIRRLSQEYEVRLTQLEQDLLSKGAIILENQREIERTQTIHSLWLQSNQAPNPRSKIEIYDRILEHTPGDIEVMAHKADAALALGDRDWALSLCNRILEDNPDSGLALYQRACAKAGLGEVDSAIIDLNKALELTPALLEEAQKEEEFTPLVGLADFDSLMNRPTADAPVTPMKDGAA
jgi:tetratricopeptide (TPR) repeat protein